MLKAGFNQKQAEAISGAQMTQIETLLSQVATKTEMHAEFQKVNAEFQNVRAEIKDVRHELKAYVHKSTTTIMITMITLAGVILAAIPFLESLNL